MTIQILGTEIWQLKQDKQYLCHLAHTMMAYLYPSPIYSMYLKEQIISLQIRALAIGNSYHILVFDQFIQSYFHSEEEDKKILCA